MIRNEELGKSLLILNVIWFAMLGSLAIYLFIGLQFARNLQVSLNRDTMIIVKWVFYAMAFIILVLTPFIRKFILSAKRGDLQTVQKITSPMRYPMLHKYATAMVVSWAMSESIGIYGLVLFILGKNTTDLYLLILVSAAAVCMYRPKKDEVINVSKGYRTPL